MWRRVFEMLGAILTVEEVATGPSDKFGDR